jgi:galactokinase
LVKLSQKAENEFVGVKCGIMDQFASMFGQSDHVIKLDCRSMEYEYYPFDMSEYRIVLCDTQIKHSLASSEYNTRRQECEMGVEILQKHYPEVKTLRDATMEMLRQHKEELGSIIFKRCKHVIEENKRVEDACEALKNNDHLTFGKKMYQSHRSLSEEYEVSCKELDFLVEQTEGDHDVLGSRMMGGGFGGCTINLVKREYVNKFIEKTTIAYKSQLGLELKVYIDSIAHGTSLKVKAKAI